MPDKRFLGSTLIIVFGLLYFVSAPASLQSGGSGAGIIAGPVMIIGAIAYRSRKRRLLGQARAILARKIFEVVALAAILLVVSLQRDLKSLIAADPVPNLIIPLCTFVAYIFAGLRTKPD